MKNLKKIMLVLVMISSLVPMVTASAANYAQIEGSGSTWSKVIIDQWISDVDASGMKVTYNGSGSSQGRKDFANGVTDFGVSEIPYQGKDEFGGVDSSNGREFSYLPIVAGGTAFTYHLEVGGKLVKNLRLSGETIAKIFTNRITNWNDPAIAKDNNGRKFPSLAIKPVVRADGSGTTAQFTRFLDTEYPSIWRPYFGRSGLTSYFPKKGLMIGQAGSDQVMNTITSSAGNGDIGYVEYSYPVNANYPVVKVLNKGGFFVEPTQFNVAVALTQARINTDKNSPMYLTQILDGVYKATDPRAYPLSSYSYMLIPTGKSDRRMTTAKRQTIADFMFYSLCQGQSKAGAYGYSPLPLNLVQAGFQQLAKLKAADKAVDLTNRDVTKCNNPTFVSGNLTKNHLAEVAPMPAACDKVGAGPCGNDTGTGTPTTKNNAKPSTSTEPSSGTTGTTTGTNPGAVPIGSNATADAIDPETGQPMSTSTSAGGPIAATPTELTANRTGDNTIFGGFAVLELLLLVLLPGLYTAFMRRNVGRKTDA